MARSWLLLSPSVLSRKGWKVVRQEVITPHASSLWSVDSFVAHFHKCDLCSQLSAELELLSSALLCWYDGGRRQDVRYEPSLLPAASVRCGQGQDSPQQRSLQQHNCGAEGERATPHISISSPTPAVEHYITTTTLLLCLSLCWCWWSPRTPAFEPTPAPAAAHLSRAAVLTAYWHHTTQLRSSEADARHSDNWGFFMSPLSIFTSPNMWPAQGVPVPRSSRTSFVLTLEQLLLCPA